MYSHRQTGWVIITVMVATLTPIFYFVPARAWQHPVFVISMGFTILMCMLFSSLKVEETGDNLKISFGPGFPRKNIPFADIASCEKVSYHWIVGYGIHLISGGWMYNVSGNQAVKLNLRNGKVYQVGTDEPDQLMAVIRRRLETSPHIPLQ
jgi:hypothetical protein